MTTFRFCENSVPLSYVIYIKRLTAGANDGSQTYDLPITNRMTHERKPDFRAILSQVSGGTPPGSSSWVLA
jgi:hypothetical protein